MSELYSIHIRPDAPNPIGPELASILERLLPVKLDFSPNGGGRVAGEIAVETSAPRGADVPRLTLRAAANSASEDKAIALEVHFADDVNVPFPFRGRSLTVKTTEPKILSVNGTDIVLAATQQGPVWTMSNERGKHFKSAFAVPALPPEGNLSSVFNGDRFLEMLPLLQWIRQLCAPDGFEGPPMRACFVFDDPNLHWPRYGFVDYRRIAAQAAKENYHVSFATIPLDTWFTHAETARLFRSHADRLSLVIHGNDHIRLELARDYTPQQRTFLLRQAIHRIERLERKAGISVSRVMIPPHGACSEAMLRELTRCGFEAACISHGSLQAHNPSKSWTRYLGYLPSELIEGCPVLPRWGLSGNTNHTILVAAFLKQPIILRGHHQDLKKDGVELLDEVAKFINGLGPVSWLNLTELSRINYLHRLEGDLLRLKPLGHKLNIKRPAQAARFMIEHPLPAGESSWQLSTGNGATIAVPAGESVPLPASCNGAFSISAAAATPTTEKRFAHHRTATAFVRRLLTESRDRFLS